MVFIKAKPLHFHVTTALYLFIHYLSAWLFKFSIPSTSFSKLSSEQLTFLCHQPLCISHILVTYFRGLFRTHWLTTIQIFGGGGGTVAKSHFFRKKAQSQIFRECSKYASAFLLASALILNKMQILVAFYEKAFLFAHSICIY